MDETFYLGFALIKLSKLLIYETYYGDLQPHFEEKNIKCHYIETDASVLSINSIKTTED